MSQQQQQQQPPIVYVTPTPPDFSKKFIETFQWIHTYFDPYNYCMLFENRNDKGLITRLDISNDRIILNINEDEGDLNILREYYQLPDLKLKDCIIAILRKYEIRAYKMLGGDTGIAVRGDNVNNTKNTFGFLLANSTWEAPKDIMNKIDNDTGLVTKKTKKKVVDIDNSTLSDVD